VVGPLDLLAFRVGLDSRLAVELGKTAKIELGPLDGLDLLHMDVLQGVDRFNLLGDVRSDGVDQKVLDQVLDVAGRGGLLHGVDHDLPDRFSLVGLAVSGALDLLLVLGGEADDEEPELEVVGGLDVAVGADHGVLLPDHLAVLVPDQAHAVEVGQAVLALNIFADQTELPEVVAVLSLEVLLVDVVDAVLETVSGDLVTDGLGDEGLADVPLLEHVGGLDVEPFLLDEGVDDLLLAALFGLGV